VFTGYDAPYEYPLSYARRIHLDPGRTYTLLVHFSSGYYAAPPILEVLPEQAFLQSYTSRTILALFGLGAILMLALYNAVLSVTVRDRAYLYYALFLATYVVGWASILHVFSHGLGLHSLALVYLPFFLGPIFNTLFFLEFLKLEAFAPRLAKASRALIGVTVLLALTVIFAQSAMHTVVSLVMFVWLGLGLAAGIVCLRRGFRPARYFVLAFLALLTPGLILIPANLQLMPLPVSDPEVLALYGGVFDALLLSLALADRIRLLEVAKDDSLKKMQVALKVARTDALTGIPNRFAFEEAFQTTFSANRKPGQVLFVIDLDGLKAINDEDGHVEGDKLLRDFATKLGGIADATCFRLGGDEFTILAQADREFLIREGLEDIERDLRASGYPKSGVSFGVCTSAEIESGVSALTAADERMYAHKQARKLARANYRPSQFPPRPTPTDS
jgi:diguanylate cyclase (GGDEF)-like protein